jgi:hypothetical protein
MADKEGGWATVDSVLRRAIPVVLDIHSAPWTFNPAVRGGKKSPPP